VNGKFQSYKYFWHNRDEILKHLYINNTKIDEINDKLKSLGKEIISIHVTVEDNCYVLLIEYYKKALSYYDLENYQIILFSDNTAAKEKLKDLNLNFIDANELYERDEDQFYMMCLSKIRICANSSFSLMSCYLNEMCNFKNDCKYYFPNKWFESDGIEYDTYDIIMIDNDKFKIVQTKKCAVIFFHKNIYNLYQKYWIDKCVDSVLNQKMCEFDIFEINYGNEDRSIFNDKTINSSKHKYNFYMKNYNTHTEAMLFLLNEAFVNDNYDVVFNTNLDDYYNEHRFIYQLDDIVKNNNEINSTMWTYISQSNDSESDEPHNIEKNTFVYENKEFMWEKVDNIGDNTNKEKIEYESIKKNLLAKHNVLNHSGLCFTRKFWNSCDKYGNKLRYRDDKPFEDLSLWTRSIENNISMGIINKILIYYRIHQAQIGTKSKNIDKLSKTEKKEFKKSMDSRAQRNGLLITIDNENEIAEILNNIADHYFIYINKNLENNLFDHMDANNIYDYDYVTYDDKINNYCKIIQLFEMKIELACDNFKIHNSNKIIFYTCYYIIKSKFNFETYITWGKKMLNFLKNYKLIFFTNSETYERIKHILNNYSNIKIIIKEFEEFELYNHIDFLKKNTDKLYFPHNDICEKLILIWINRHFFVKELKNNYYADFYSYVDFGYFRDIDNDDVLTMDVIKLNKTCIQLGLINNEEYRIDQIYKIITNCSKEKLEYLLTTNFYSFGGGGNIIPYSMINAWLYCYEDILMKFINNNAYFKDDQIIIAFMVLNKQYNNLFSAITIKKEIIDNNFDWFPLIKLLKNADDPRIIYNNFNYLFDNKLFSNELDLKINKNKTHNILFNII
jgi:hypothetical protein